LKSYASRQDVKLRNGRTSLPPRQSAEAKGEEREEVIGGEKEESETVG
jgi:hypothetical protein